VVCRSNDAIARTLMRRANGKHLAKEALAKAEYKIAWEHVVAYGLDEFDIMELGLPEKYRPKHLRGRDFPKAEGCV